MAKFLVLFISFLCATSVYSKNFKFGIGYPLLNYSPNYSSLSQEKGNLLYGIGIFKNKKKEVYP